LARLPPAPAGKRCAVPRRTAHFTFHLKESATADLPATARPVTDPAEREKVLAGLLAGLDGFAGKPGQEPEVWVASSPLVEVTFTGSAEL
jgi:hypothetical protein